MNLEISYELTSYSFFQNSLYIGTDNEIIRVPVDRCNRYETQISCLRAKDPYCGWDTNKLECTVAPNRNTQASSWIQEVMGCPKTLESG